MVVEGIRYSKNGNPRMYIIQGVPIIVNEVVIGGYGIYTDITERKAAEDEVMYMSYHDQLTGLFNRRYFEKQFEDLDYEENMPLGLIMADMNGLKLINDAFGHNSGDELLKKTGEILNTHCFESHIVARLGGDEFVILIPNISENEIEKVVKRFKSICREERHNGIDFSLSFGSGTKISTLESNKNLFKKVEDQMYRNKLVESPSIRGKMFDTVIKTLHAKNEREERHSSRVSEYCESIARALKMNSELVKEMKTAGWLHDIGKIAIADSYDAMTSDRTYRDAMTKETAIQQLREHSGSQFDPWLVEVFIPLIK